MRLLRRSVEAFARRASDPEFAVAIPARRGTVPVFSCLAIGGQVAASLLAASLLANGYPSEHGYTTTFVVMASVLAASVAASLAVPSRRPHRTHLVTLAEAQGSLE